MGKITDEELAMLSDEERAAIADDTVVKSTEEIKAEEEAEAARLAKESGAGAAVRADATKTAEEIAAAEATEAAAKEKAAADAAAAAKVQADKEAADLAEAQKREADEKAAEAATAAATAAALHTPASPAFILEAEKKHGTKEEIETKMAELDTKFEDGDIKLSEYNLARAEYVEALTEMKMFDKINTQVQAAAAEKGWKDAQADFFKQNTEYLGERIKNVAFVDAVNRLLASDSSKTMTDAQIFEAAKTECDAVFYPTGRAKPAAADAGAKKNEEDAKKKADEAKALEEARKVEAAKAAGVQTLARVPVSEGNQGEDKYDQIDKLNGLAYEEAVARLSDAERAIYSARA